MWRWFVLWLILGCVSRAFSAERDYGSVEVCPGHVRAVLDGDTFTVDVPGWPPLLGEAIAVRLAGIDTPERRDPRPAVRELAAKARMLLVEELRQAKKIELRQLRRDKYFRIDAWVFVDGRDLAEKLVVAGVAQRWDGTGPRPIWKDPTDAENR